MEVVVCLEQVLLVNMGQMDHILTTVSIVAVNSACKATVSTDHSDANCTEAYTHYWCNTRNATTTPSITWLSSTH